MELSPCCSKILLGWDAFLILVRALSQTNFLNAAFVSLWTMKSNLRTTSVNLFVIKFLDSRQLQQKHEKYGISQIHMETTTKLICSMKPDNHFRVPLIRLLTDAQNAPEDRVNKAGLIPTEHCRFCLHEQSSVEHILWDCRVSDVASGMAG